MFFGHFDTPILLDDEQFARLELRFGCRRRLYSGPFTGTNIGSEGSIYIYSRGPQAGVDDEFVGVSICDGGGKRELFMSIGIHSKVAVEGILGRPVVTLFQTGSKAA